MSKSISLVLDQLQSEMEKEGLWQSVPPAAEKMMSIEPFSIDTLTFTEWLQWVYVARLRAIIDAKAELPTGAQVAPYAEESFRVEDIQSLPILRLIRQLDDLLS